MRTKTNNVKALISGNHNETLIRDNSQARDLKIKIQVKTGKVSEISFNHNKTWSVLTPVPEQLLDS